MAANSELVTMPDVRAALPAPAFSGAEMAQALHSYQEMQQALDKAMPDQLMTIEGRVFRKKGYWRTVARAFRLRVELLREDRISGTDDWGFTVSYRAFTPSGDQADGDGACSASEKQGTNKYGQPFDNATLHNVRAHAHTRAYNRAVSNLVGFGEVSAEECERDDRPPARPALRAVDPEPWARDVTPEPERLPNPAGLHVAVASKAQVKRFWALCSARAEKLEGVSRTDIARDVLGALGIEHSDQIPLSQYDRICHAVSLWDVPSPGAEPAVDDGGPEF